MPKELNLNSLPVEVLKVTIGETVYTLPLANALPYSKVRKLIKISKSDDTEEQIDTFIAFFKEYIPEEVVENLPMASLTALAKAWGDTSEENGGSALGES